MTSRDDAVRCLLEPPRWLLAALDGEHVASALRRNPPEALGSARIVDCRAVDLRLTGQGWSAWYDVTTLSADGETAVTTLTGDVDPQAGLRQRAAGGDTALPAVEQLADPSRAIGLLRQALPGHALPTGCEPRLARYARGTRATVVYRLHYEPGTRDVRHRTVVAKAYSSEEGAATFEAMNALWGTELATGEIVSIAEPLGYLPEQRVLVQGRVPGERTLTALLLEAAAAGEGGGTEQLRIALRHTADGLAALHACGVSSPVERTPEWLFRRVRKAIARLSGTVPALVGTADALLHPLETRASDVPGESTVASHGGFRPAQVLVRGADLRVGFIDFDGFCTAEPAFDLGRFRARLREIGLAAPAGRTEPLSPERRDVVNAMAAEFLARYDSRRPVSRERVALWEELELVTALVQTWTRGQFARAAPLAALLRSFPG